MASVGASWLEVEALFPPGTNTSFGVLDGGERFVEKLEVRGFDSASPPSKATISLVDGEWKLAACTSGCRVSYRFALRRAAESLGERGSAELLGSAIQAPISTWLLRPLAAAPNIPVLVHVRVAEGETFASGVPRLDGSSASVDARSTYVIRTADALDLPYTVFGTAVQVPPHLGVEAVLVGNKFQQQAKVLAWLGASTDVVRAYYGQPPIAKVLVIVNGVVGEGVGFGSTTGMSGAAIRIDVGQNVTTAALQEDWVLIHELIHTALPELTQKHRWLEEGLATYIEPVARAQAGVLSEQKVWGEWLRRMRLGLPKAGDLGLNRTPTWGRTYWGGALFCLLADVQIRERTENRASLGDALRAIVAHGGNVGVIWPIEKVLTVGDEATGVSVLHELYEKLARQAGGVDLPELFQKLGVRLERGRAVFDDNAPLAAIRRALLKPTR